MQTTRPSNAAANADLSIRRKSAGSWLRTTTALIISCLSVVVTLEVIFAFAGIGETNYLQRHAVLGWLPVGGKVITCRDEGFCRVKLNSHGMVDVERSLAKPAGTGRVAVLGDSYVMALQVPLKENFCSQLESELTSNAGRRWEVLNFGVTGYNLAQKYLRLKDVVHRFQPDTVVLALRVTELAGLVPDPRLGFFGARPYFFLDDRGRLVEDRTLESQWQHGPEARRMRLTAWLRQNSRIWAVGGECCRRLSGWWQGLQNAQTKPGGEGVRKSLPEVGRQPEAVKDTALALLAECRRTCELGNCRLTVLYLPGSHGLYSEEEAHFFRNACETLRLPYLDLNPVFRKAAELDSRGLFYAVHLGPRGHAMVSHELRQFLAPSLSASPARDEPIPSPGSRSEAGLDAGE